jgi:tryptophanyl-tRNA synthetase
MPRTLTGIQSTGVPHLGNLLGAIIPTIEASKSDDNETFGFIANLHSLTSVKDAELIRESSYAVAATWLAFGLDVNKNVFYRQSDVPEVCELAWYLNCFMSFQRLSLAHSFKDKSDRASEVTAGLFTYPVLMAADILLYDAEVVPVGKDQKQHLEFTRDLAKKLNTIHKDLFVIPEIQLHEKNMYVPGVDGKKMSKSYGNTIDIFLTDKKLRKCIMSIVTDDKDLEDVKDPNTCVVFDIYSLLATNKQIKEMRANYLGGGYGYGHAKQALYELVVDLFKYQREKYWELMDNKPELDKLLKIGADKARNIAKEKLRKVRVALGF